MIVHVNFLDINTKIIYPGMIRIFYKEEYRHGLSIVNVTERAKIFLLGKYRDIYYYSKADLYKIGNINCEKFVFQLLP